MDGRLEPNPQPENENDLNDEDVIDLTQIAEEEDDGDIIELKDVLVQPDQAPDEADENEDAVISLEDTIPADDAIQLADEADDEIIELMDMATTLETDIAEWEEEASTAQEDEAVVDLVDPAEIDAPEEDALESPFSDDGEEIVELVDAVEPAVVDPNEEAVDRETPEEAARTSGPDSEQTLFEVDEHPLDGDGPPAPGFDEPATATERAEPPAPANMPDEASLTTEMPLAAASPSGNPPAGSIPLNDEQVEKALERVIEKIYGQRIEHLMIQTIEKTVRREIEKIKHALTADDVGLDE